ncbi:MAG TPA: Gfo/Idh/MocA family oxidoreductase [Candidatus Acidoferrales bacterium]|nr:Gfo/Idh/MocA family oxidoreductase [Candidatus Acidoferrales bacterium]
MTTPGLRVAVIGCGDFGRNHVRVYRELGAEIAGVYDTDAARRERMAAEFGVPALAGIENLAGRVDAASVAVPTISHAQVGCALLAQGIDVLVEKPMAASLKEADDLIAAARARSRILQVGHLERFNPGLIAAQPHVARPLFFEVHRLGIFSPRSLDVDVIYDVMIHDLDILLTLVGQPVVDVRAVGIPVVTPRVDIAHARLEFSTGAVANVTASRVSTERVRKLRFFQTHEYLSVDFARRDAMRIRVAGTAGPASSTGSGAPTEMPQFAFEKLTTEPVEPLRAELQSFLECVRTRRTPLVDGQAGRRALELADRVMAGILEHRGRVQLDELVPEHPR